MTVAIPPRRNYVHAWAILLASLLIPLPMLAGKTLEAVLDTVNPAGVDVSQGLAYLRELLTFSLGFIILQVVVIVVLVVIEYRRQRTYWSVAIPVSIVIAQVVAGLALLVTNGVVDGVEAAYTSSLSG